LLHRDRDFDPSETFLELSVIHRDVRQRRICSTRSDCFMTIRLSACSGSNAAAITADLSVRTGSGSGDTDPAATLAVGEK